MLINVINTLHDHDLIFYQISVVLYWLYIDV